MGEAVDEVLVLPIDLGSSSPTANTVITAEASAVNGGSAVDPGAGSATPAAVGPDLETTAAPSNAGKPPLPNETIQGTVSAPTEGRVAVTPAATEEAEATPVGPPRAVATAKAETGESATGALEAAKQFAALRSEKPGGEATDAPARINPVIAESKARPEAGVTPLAEAPADRAPSVTQTVQPGGGSTAASSPEPPSSAARATADVPDPGSVEANSRPTNAPSELGSAPKEGATRMEVLRTQQASEAEIAELPPRILRLVRQALRRREGGIKIQLDPPHLGRVDVEFKVGKGRFGVRMEVDSQEVKEALLQDLDHLRESLAAFQTEPGSLEVEVRDREPSEGSDGSRSGGARGGEATDGSEVEREVSVATPEYLGRQIDRKG